MDILIGVANSVSANFEYDPIDALNFAVQSNFDSIQIYLTEKMVLEKSALNGLLENFSNNNCPDLFIHAEASFNKSFFESEYYEKLFEISEQVGGAKILVHYDETSPLEDNLKFVSKLAQQERQIWIENYYQFSGSLAAEKNMRKYLALFTLSNSHGHEQVIHPVLDVPRFFHKNLEFDEQQAVQWCYQMFNFFSNKRIPIVFHLIDCKDDAQERSSFCPIGEGVIPYDQIFDFIKKTQPQISGIIFEYEDKINPLKARDIVKNALK